MNILNKIFSAGATELVKGVGGVLDSLTTTKEEKLEAARKIKELVLNREQEMQKEVSNRWEADMKSDSWLSKNVRPLVLIFLVEPKWTDLLQLVLITVIGAYFGGRSLEKTKK